MRDLQVEIKEWAQQKGWWDDGRTFGDHIALIHSEASEALEAFRETNDPTTVWYREDGKPEGVPSELADIIIRVLHLAEHYNIDLGEHLRIKLDYNTTRAFRHGNRAL